MGCFSRITCDTNKRIINGKRKNVYVLIPERFGGGHIKESCYDGFGMYGGKDIYDLVAEWNREYLKDICNRTDWECDWSPEIKKIALIYCNEGEEAVTEFINKSYPANHYLKVDWKRNVGICLACFDEDNERLPYPIKIAESATAIYEECTYSKRDREQGCC